MANSSNRRLANDEAEGSRADARQRWWSLTSSQPLLKSFSTPDYFSCVFQVHPVESCPRSSHNSGHGERFLGVV
jgi:hypothetical protein